MALGKFDWSSFPKDAKIRFLEDPVGYNPFITLPKTWKIVLPASSNLYKDCGCGDGIADEVIEWMDMNLHGCESDPSDKGSIWRFECPITNKVTYECLLYSERDFILFKMRFQ